MSEALKVIIKSLSTVSVLATGLMIGRNEQWWLILPFLGVLIFYGRTMAEMGAESERRKMKIKNMTENIIHHSKISR